MHTFEECEMCRDCHHAEFKPNQAWGLCKYYGFRLHRESTGSECPHYEEKRVR